MIFSRLKDSEFLPVIKALENNELIPYSEFTVPVMAERSNSGFEFFHIMHKRYDNYYYTIFLKQGRWELRYSPGTKRNSDYIQLRGFDPVYTDNSGVSIQHWLRLLKTELDAKKEIQNFHNIKQIFTDSPITAANFTEVEIVHWVEKLDSVQFQLENKMHEFATLTADELSIISSDLDFIKNEINHLKEMIEKLDKLDWVKLLIGSATGYVPTMVMDPNVENAFKEAVSSIFQSLHLNNVFGLQTLTL